MEAGGPTHIHTPSLRTQTCVSMPLSLYRLETKSSATESVGTEHHYGNQHSGPGCGHCDFFGIRSVLESIIEFPLLNVLPQLANDLLRTVVFFLKKQNKTKTNAAMRFSFTENKNERGS